MKSKFVNCFLGLAVFCSATLFFSGPMAAAASIEDQCRAAARAEMKGPNCRSSNSPARDPTTFHPCNISNSETPFYTDKVVKCVARGGPGRAAR
jgi:hypothetical protein